MIAIAPKTSSREPVGQIAQTCVDQGLFDVAARLWSLRVWIADDMSRFEADLALLERGTSLVHQSAHHLLDLGGKHLRPMCVVLASRLGRGFGPQARNIAIAVELIHNATLLHDDVIDTGDHRRGAPAARTIYGNAASILSGDWLLIEALKRVRRVEQPEPMDRMLATVGRMIAAEALQLANRGNLLPKRTDYFRVVLCKTAALFRWALFCGARVAGLTRSQCIALERYGARLGVAFQLVDDLLDLTGDPVTMGKPLLKDLRDGEVTYPLLLAVERDPSLKQLVASALSGSREASDLSTQLRAALADTGAARECLALARQQVHIAVRCLAVFPDGPARAALVTLAEATVRRQS